MNRQEPALSEAEKIAAKNAKVARGGAEPKGHQERRDPKWKGETAKCGQERQISKAK